MPRRWSFLGDNPPSPISKLGDDLLFEILIRLPNPRSACRSKAVCKQWRSLVSKPCFSRRFLSHHQSKNKPPPPKLILSADSLLSFLPVPGLLPDEEFVVFDCFKDLLLCGFRSRANPQLARSYLLCNPFTEQWVALPLAPERPVWLRRVSARLVCEPLISDSHDLGGGYDYRLRVVFIYQDRNSVKLDMFCSESGEWTKEAGVVEGYRLRLMHDVVSCNGVLYASYLRAEDEDSMLYSPLIVGFNPFRPDIPLTRIDVSPLSNLEFWNMSISQGALHLAVFEHIKPMVLSVWRLKEDGKHWRKVYEGPVKSSPGDDYNFGNLYVPTLHPEKPEIAFFTHTDQDDKKCRLSCNVGSGGELEFVSKITRYFNGWRVFEPKVHCWPTPIPRYQKLRARYDGRIYCWVQSNEPVTSSMTELNTL
ncbi:unnamed protein product [Linum trigynum]|uniref:F-box domain-containing protein n=1 Tax=Linum trigynum TaxID=586398 RepID=A0AAV2DTK8_9ROSI